jgi:hypothetical protein
MYDTAFTATTEPTPTDVSFGQVDQPYAEPVAQINPEVSPETTTATQEPETVPRIYALVREVVPSGAYEENAAKLEFDIILNVNLEGTARTLVKKIAFCKYALAKELLAAEASGVTVVEDKKPTELSKDDANRLRALYSY